MKNKYFGLHLHIGNKRYLVVFIAALLSACSSGGGGGGGGSCDTVANANASAFFQVQNKLGGGLEWYLPDYAFGADMRPGECTVMGVTPSQYTLQLMQCNLTGDSGCTSYNGSTKYITFSVAQDETFKLTVDASTF